MIIAISLLWLRHKTSGGVESYTRNILEGLKSQKNNNKYILICSEDNADSFSSYEEDSRFEIHRCAVKTRDTKRMIYYENFKLDKLVSRLGADTCFVPTYRMPLLFFKNRYIVVIHDLVAHWYPQNFSKFRRKWLQWGWRRSVVKAERVIAISKFVKEDIIQRYGEKYEKKIEVIYNPILPTKNFEDFNHLAEKYKIEKYNYFYTVSSTIKHKNLVTLIRMMSLFVKSRGQDNTPKLLISGVGLVGSEAKTHFETNNILSLIKEESLEDFCILTGFVSNERRNTLMKYAKVFLFPSVFEGFGMPPVEAMEIGTPVVTTNCTALPEVTKGECEYVSKPYDEEEWLKAIEKISERSRMGHHFDDYNISNVIKKYLDCFEGVVKACEK